MCCMGAGAFKENKLSFMGFRIIIFFFSSHELYSFGLFKNILLL